MALSLSWLVFLLAAVQFVHIVDFMVMMPLGPQLMRVMELDPQHFGFLVGAYTLAAGLSGFLGVFWLDRFSRKKALAWSFAGFVVGTGLCALAPNYEFLLVARLLAGALGGVLSALVMAIVGDVFPPEQRGRATATVMAAFSAAAVAGVPFGLFLSNHWGWQSPFVFLACVGAVIALLLLKVLPPLDGHLQQGRSHHPWQILREVLSAKSRVLGLALTGVLIIGQFAVIPYIAPFLVANAGLAESHLPLIYITGGALTILSSQLIGRMADRFGKKLSFRILALASILPLLWMTHLPVWPLWALLGVAGLFFILVSGRMIPAMALINGTVEPQRRAAFLSLNGSVQQLAAAAGSSLSGIVIVKGADGTLLHYGWIGIWAALTTLIGVFLIGGIKPLDQGKN